MAVPFTIRPSVTCPSRGGSIARYPALVLALAVVSASSQAAYSWGRMMIAQSRPHAEIRPRSWRDDPAVPEFDDMAGPVAVVDGDCALCSFGAQVIARHDRSGRVRICPARAPLGSALLHHFGLSPDMPESWLFIEDGHGHLALDGVIRLARHLGPAGWPLRPLALLPRPLRDWIYRRIARNRFALFGRADLCALPDPALRARLLE